MAALAVIPMASGATRKPVKKTVRVGDYFLTPKKLTVPPNSTIAWKWNDGDSHNVTLRKRPKGVKAFHSAIASSDYTYRHKLVKKGTYVVICTLHPDTMRQTITVK
jgi:plastocyanin